MYNKPVCDRVKEVRGMRFGELVGNEAVKRQVSALVDAGHFPHALLLEGEEGSGRRTLAMQLARAATCRGAGERPCGTCAACVKTEHPDITLCGGDGKPLTVDTIRQLRQEAYVLPNEAPYRVIILAKAQTMTPQAQNALLKILEEPPAHVLFILTCENRTQLLETIRSRCVALTMQAVAWEEAAPVLRSRLPGKSDEELQRAHSLFGGMIGRVIAGVQEDTFRQVLELTPQFAEALVAVGELPLLRLTARLEKDKELTAATLAGLTLILRDALACRYGADSRLSTAPDTATRLAQKLTGTRLMALLQTADALQRDHKRNMNNTLFLTRMSARLRQAAGY